MVCLAKIGGVSPTGMIASQEGISADYLEKIFIRLKRAGLVRTVRGSKGGYALARLPQKITVGEILRALEGNFTSVHCLDSAGGSKDCCPRQKICPTKNVWKKLQDALNKALDCITLKSLIK